MKKLPILLFFALFAGTTLAQKPGKWKNLFDGKTTKGWHSYHQTDVKGWMVMSGALMTHGGNGDLITNEDYEDFEFEFEFKIPAKSNSGVIYKVIEDPKNATYYSGPEYQIIDDEGYPPFNDGGKMVRINDKQKTAANYDMQAPNQWVAKPAGEWNKGRILIKNNHIEHWLNGVKVVEYDYGSDAWKAQLAQSKFTKWPYATPHTKGKIALQDHGDEVWFRNMRIRPL
ncbi:3-keto-disaccharide hydrolase [Arundinibacter roseus]|uniref:DUF1080 domain-containing protein n=1 Tax=Arundinibacter roseus TaxID=2070510 RepID=A0A4R4JSA8_9BACT|nr:DUF1080 domain-containing protein [Arundinibacter roseus]TDB57363.1 DUF1080 domain-containing protein [Arundinibacter roseus]